MSKKVDQPQTLGVVTFVGDRMSDVQEYWMRGAFVRPGLGRRRLMPIGCCSRLIGDDDGLASGGLACLADGFGGELTTSRATRPTGSAQLFLPSHPGLRTDTPAATTSACFSVSTRPQFPS